LSSANPAEATLTITLLITANKTAPPLFSPIVFSRGVSEAENHRRFFAATTEIHQK